MQAQFTDWSDAILASLSNAFAMLFSSIPRIVGFLVILATGWIIAALVARALASLLRAAHFDGFAERAGLAGLLQRSGGKQNTSGVVAGIVKWFVRLITLMVAFDALGLLRVICAGAQISDLNVHRELGRLRPVTSGEELELRD